MADILGELKGKLDELRNFKEASDMAMMSA